MFGLALSIALMARAAAAVARLLNRHRWIAYVGLLVIVFVVLHMIVQGADELIPIPTLYHWLTSVSTRYR